MPRAPRQISVTGFYHVILRGVNKQDIFYEDEDRERMLSCLQRFTKELGIGLTAYCLMTNHIHILLNAQETPGTFVQKIASSYVYYFNQKYGRIGHLFQDRYKCEPVNNVGYLLTVFRYILQNPEKAGIGSTKHYKWSSWRELCGRKGLCQMDAVIAAAGGREALLEFVLTESDESCLDICLKPEFSEEEALRVAKEILGENPQAITNYKGKLRTEAIRKMHEAGLTQKQIVRLSGVGRKLVWRTLQKKSSRSVHVPATRVAGGNADSLSSFASHILPEGGSQLCE